MSRIQARPSAERDGEQPWSKQELETMNDRFVAAMARAIRSGRERVPSTACEPKNNPGLEPGLDAEAAGSSVAAFGF